MARRESSGSDADSADDAKPLRDKTWRKGSYRGYILYNCDVERMVRCDHSGFAKHKLKDYPNKVWWPVPHDDAGAKEMVDAILARDIGQLRGLLADYPGHTFGFESMIPDGIGAGDIIRHRHLSSRSLVRGYRLDVELVKLRGGDIVKRAAIRRGGETIACKTLATYPSHPQPA